MSEGTAEFSVETRTPCTLLTLSRQDLQQALAESPEAMGAFRHAVESYLALKSEVNRYGERNIDLVSGFAENVEIPETFVDYSASPREYSLSAIQTVVRVHTRQRFIQRAIRSTRGANAAHHRRDQREARVGADQSLQVWPAPFGRFCNATQHALRSSDPDDLDDLLALVWKKPAFFLAHPEAIAAFERECTWRGVPPVTESLFGYPIVHWRGVPMIPCDKLEIKSRDRIHEGLGTTNILLLRVGEADQGWLDCTSPEFLGRSERVSRHASWDWMVWALPLTC